jgi:hypothetical protein
VIALPWASLGDRTQLLERRADDPRAWKSSLRGPVIVTSPLETALRINALADAG